MLSLLKHVPPSLVGVNPSSHLAVELDPSGDSSKSTELLVRLAPSGEVRLARRYLQG